ncbi:hypothetical protein [Paracoccus sp. MKU1]|uniref:hypothetical protein n=1 Tax=Paracoccus sp. MKU1 TaxID=1745182 RepID=UPI000A7D0A20|nr:hypothetical protein [Paracoccus sp. MKU1]
MARIAVLTSTDTGAWLLALFLKGHEMKAASFVINVGFGLGLALGAVALLLL